MESVTMYRATDGRIFRTEGECNSHEDQLKTVAKVQEVVTAIQNKLVEVQYDIDKLMEDFPQFGMCLFIDNSMITKPKISFMTHTKKSETSRGDCI